MLVIISDLHLTDGTSGDSIPAGAFALFADRLRELASTASWRTGGEYRPIERIDVLLLGDVLDVIRSARWLQDNVRPWSDPQSQEMIDVVAAITADILRHNGEGLNLLRELAAGIQVPPVNRWGQPVNDAIGSRAAVNIFFMVGNHDWFYHLPGSAYDAIRQMIVQQIGLVNAPGAPFPHDPTESDAILETLRRHKVLARHGDIFDPLNFSGDCNVSSLGDAIVIELVNRFAAEVAQQLGDQLPAAVLAGLQELDNIRPTMMVPVWIDGLLDRTCPLPATRKAVKGVWDRLVDRFLQLDFVREHDRWNPLTEIDQLERVLKFSKRLSLGSVSAIVEWLQRLRGAESASYYKHALSEADFRNRRARHIVYGHTNVAESVPLDASYADGFLLNQMYFNSGTWRRMYRATQLAPAEHEFIPSDCLTYLAFYQGDERQGRPFESWTGMLGMQTPQMSTLRIDPAATSAVPAPNRRAPAIAKAPHVGAAGQRAPIIPTRRS